MRDGEVVRWHTATNPTNKSFEIVGEFWSGGVFATLKRSMPANSPGFRDNAPALIEKAKREMVREFFDKQKLNWLHQL